MSGRSDSGGGSEGAGNTARTIDDLAARVGMARSTVSRALNGRAEVSPATRAKVQAAAKELGYYPSPHAARLAGGRTGAVAVVVPRVTRWFYATVVETLETDLQHSGLDLLLVNLSGREDKRAALFRGRWLPSRADAVVLVAIPLAPAELAVIDSWRLPGVTVSSGTPVTTWSSIRIDDAAAAGLAVRHLLHLGHRRIAHVSGPTHHPLASTTHLDRRGTFHDLVSSVGGTPILLEDDAIDFTVEGGVRATRALLATTPPPTAIFAASDEMAMGAMMAARQLGLHVPNDLSVIGIDNHPLSQAVDLTTVAQSADDQATTASRLLTAALADPGHRVEHHVSAVDLVVRGSTARPVNLA